MLTVLLREMLEPAFAAAALRLKWSGLALALVGFGLGLIALALAGRHIFLPALALLLAGRPIFATAAAAARACGSKGEETLAALLGDVALAGFPFAFALAVPENAVSAAFLLFAMTALFSAAFAFADGEGRHGGPLGEAEILLAFALAAIVPEWFGPVAYAAGILCFVAAGFRIDAGLGSAK